MRWVPPPTKGESADTIAARLSASAGTSADPSELMNPEHFPVFEAGRGGRYTYHGPGQRVGYVMLDLDRRVVTDRREDGMIPEKIGDILAHVFLHDIHHRGQVHAMLSGTSVAPPQLDEFLLDYDLKLRKAEVERLGL